MIKEPGDEREAQALRDFDALFEELSTATQRYNLDPPPLFQSPINHTCFTFFHKKQADADADPTERETSKLKAASDFIEHLVETGKLSVLSLKKFRDVKGKY